MRLHKNNSGITLVELIISIAIAAIVLSMVALMINSAANSFKRTNEDVDIQMESQIAMNQLSTYIMEATAKVKEDGSIEEPAIEEVNDVTEVTAPDVMYKLRYSSAGSVTYIFLYFISDKNRLYLITDNPASINKEFILGKEDEYLMTEHVTGFTIDNSKTKSAKITINFGLGKQTYTAEKNIKLRNAK